MAVRIRLRRMGRKKKPHYRIVVTDRTAPRDGRFVESIGYYKPLTSPARLVLDLDRADYWIGKGAEPSDTVGSLIRRARLGGDANLTVGEESPEQAKAQKAEALAGKRQAEAEALKAAAAAEAEARVAAEAEARAAAEAEAKAAAEAETAISAPEESGADGDPPEEVADASDAVTEPREG